MQKKVMYDAIAHHLPTYAQAAPEQQPLGQLPPWF